ncbi:precorrin 3B synthase CobZ [Pochonia chlamydosporia 170]|uniref:Precorrin 3B synthase CobZ n=1 Tax=Pochonia chlamydosporia 170 TaxID=1380566 RepID=A0A179G8I3_METCM|nr:precorrin 3B synthase CobZ [Pochonia chlamydosporia 170]OAQ74116.1 precorrin 3B synthase CobZ [Pochonia chlamydosporia 170]
MTSGANDSVPSECDVLVVGSGNAGLSAAIAARQAGAGSVVLIDKCPESWAGGNSYFTAGAYRTVHEGLKDILPLVNNVSDEQAENIILEPYTADHFTEDLNRVCMGRSDPRLARTLISESNDAVKWLADLGVKFHLSFNRQAYEIDGKIKFWGGLCLKTADGGKSLIQDLRQAAQDAGVQTIWSTSFQEVKSESDTGILNVSICGKTWRAISTKAVIFAAGGFEANPRMRAAYLGPGWDMAMVRGTPYNTGECLEHCIACCDATAAGNWSGCHSVAWDANADPNCGDREASNEFTKSGYPLGLMINVDGKRFVDEGVDMRNFTYAKFGRAILEQPDHLAFQIFDARTTPWLRSEEYRPERVEHIKAQSIEELAEKCVSGGLRNKYAFINTVTEYNEAVLAHRRENPSVKWDPSVKDGLSTQSASTKLELPKSNWALPLDKGPFLAVKVSAGITFTFGGLKVDPDTAQILRSSNGSPSPGLYCVGEMMGGLFYKNYPGGSGLTSGTVFGRRAGTAAAQYVNSFYG